MKKNTYTLNTVLAAILGVVLLAAVLVRTFGPRFILPQLDIPNLVLISLAALLVDHYLAPESNRPLCSISLTYPGISAIAGDASENSIATVSISERAILTFFLMSYSSLKRIM